MKRKPKRSFPCETKITSRVEIYSVPLHDRIADIDRDWVDVAAEENGFRRLFESMREVASSQKRILAVYIPTGGLNISACREAFLESKSDYHAMWWQDNDTATGRKSREDDQWVHAIREITVMEGCAFMAVRFEDLSYPASGTAFRQAMILRSEAFPSYFFFQSLESTSTDTIQKTPTLASPHISLDEFRFSPLYSSLQEWASAMAAEKRLLRETLRIHFGRVPGWLMHLLLHVYTYLSL